MKTEEKVRVERLRGARAAAPAKSRGTQVRTRCKGRTLPSEVRAQLAEALPLVVRAQVDKAKKGSLTHAKWLWEQAQEGLKKKGPAAEKARESLAELLVKNLS